MSITKTKKQEIIKKFSLSNDDTGSPEVQIAIFSERINNLTQHLNQNPKDFHSRRGLLILVGRRKRLLNYLKENNESRYTSLIKELGLRK